MMKPCMKSRKKLTFAAVFVLLFCAVFAFAKEVRASEPVPPANRSALRAPVRRAPQETPAAASQPAAVQNVQNTQVTQVQAGQGVSLATGIRLLEQGRYKQAHPWLQRAVQEERGNPYAWYWYGMAHDKVGQYEQAQFFYAKALELDPGLPPLSRVLAYPDDGDRKALWDPIRPARVYPVELGNQDVMIVPPGSPNSTRRQPVPDVDPTLPRVPVYVPPEVPSAVPGDAVQPPLYVPPDFQSTVYAPPEEGGMMQFEFDVPAPQTPVYTPMFDSFEYIPGGDPTYIPPPPPR